MKDLSNKILGFLKKLLTAFGLLWLIVQIADYFGPPSLSEKIQSFWWLFGLLGLLYVIYRTRPKRNFTYKVPDRDAKVNIATKDIFKIRGSLIITINNKFLVDQDGNLLQANSILSQFVKKHYQSKPDLLQTEISKILRGKRYKIYKNKFKHEYKIGTTVPITIGNVNFYLLANTKLNTDNRSYCDEGCCWKIQESAH